MLLILIESAGLSFAETDACCTRSSRRTSRRKLRTSTPFTPFFYINFGNRRGPSRSAWTSCGLAVCPLRYAAVHSLLSGCYSMEALLSTQGYSAVQHSVVAETKTLKMKRVGLHVSCMMCAVCGVLTSLHVPDFFLLLGRE